MKAILRLDSDGVPLAPATLCADATEEAHNPIGMLEVFEPPRLNGEGEGDRLPMPRGY
jgi:hypothetical protein